MYDAIARQLGSGKYSFATRNIDNLSFSLYSLAAEVDDLRSRSTISITFYGWYDDSEKRAGIIMEFMQAIHRLRVVGREFVSIRDTALDTHHEILDELEEARILPVMDSRLRVLLGNLSWAGFEQ